MESSENLNERAEYLQWAKDRALEYLDNNDIKNAIASMGSDLSKKPDYFNPEMVAMLTITVMNETNPGRVRDWINGFN